jgi:hypothetical protein
VVRRRSAREPAAAGRRKAEVSVMLGRAPAISRLRKLPAARFEVDQLAPSVTPLVRIEAGLAGPTTACSTRTL